MPERIKKKTKKLLVISVFSQNNTAKRYDISGKQFR